MTIRSVRCCGTVVGLQDSSPSLEPTMGIPKNGVFAYLSHAPNFQDRKLAWTRMHDLCGKKESMPGCGLTSCLQRNSPGVCGTARRHNLALYTVWRNASHMLRMSSCVSSVDVYTISCVKKTSPWATEVCLKWHSSGIPPNGHHLMPESMTRKSLGIGDNPVCNCLKVQSGALKSWVSWFFLSNVSCV